MSLLDEIRRAQVIAAEQVVIRNLEHQGLSRVPNVKSTNKSPALELCDLAASHLVEGQRLFVSQSIVVGVNDTQPLPDRLADIDLTIRLLTVLREKLAQ